MLVRAAALLFCLLAPLAASAERPARHLSHEALMMLAPSPDIRPTVDASGQYASGGIGIIVYDGVNAMDALGPYQVFSTAGLRPMLVSGSRNSDRSPKTTVITNSGLQLTASRQSPVDRRRRPIPTSTKACC